MEVTQEDIVGRFAGVVQLVRTPAISYPDLSGVAVMPDGRIFLGFPRHADDHSGPTLAEYGQGKLIPFPDAVMSLPGRKNPANRLVSVHGMAFTVAKLLWSFLCGRIRFR
jgi:hypothetical protein